MNHVKAPNQMVSPEDVQLNTKYTFTTNPDDSYQFFSDTQSERIKKATNHMRHLMRLNPNIHLCIQMECSSKGRLHWHGTILFKHIEHIKYFYIEFIHKFLLNHTIEMDTITAEPVSKKYNSWTDYCEKQGKFNLPHLDTADVCKTKMVNPNKVYKTMDEF